MKILLLCVGGITSTILAKRLHNYSLENEKGDEFLAERYGTIDPNTLGCDLILIAPQIRKLIESSPNFEKISPERLLYVSETDYSSIDVGGLYDQIDAMRNRIDAPAEGTGKWGLDRTLIINGAFIWLAAVTVYYLICLLEKQFKWQFTMVRLLIPVIILMKYGDMLSSSKTGAKVIHMANVLCIFMLITPFKIVNNGGIDAESWSLVIPYLSLPAFSVISAIAMILYTAYNLWEDWFNVRNRFMMRFMRETLCSGLFFLFVIILKLLIAFFVRK